MSSSLGGIYVQKCQQIAVFPALGVCKAFPCFDVVQCLVYIVTKDFVIVEPPETDEEVRKIEDNALAAVLLRESKSIFLSPGKDSFGG